MMAMKNYGYEIIFMDELQTIKNESLKSAKVQNTSTNIHRGTVDSLQIKIKFSVIPIQMTLYEMIKRISQTSRRVTDLKNYKLFLKIFILRFINQK